MNHIYHDDAGTERPVDAQGTAGTGWPSRWTGRRQLAGTAGHKQGPADRMLPNRYGFLTFDDPLRRRPAVRVPGDPQRSGEN
jgi:hypothetical protein